jgi:hypothetical protein
MVGEEMEPAASAFQLILLAFAATGAYCRESQSSLRFSAARFAKMRLARRPLRAGEVGPILLVHVRPILLSMRACDDDLAAPMGAVC